MDFLNFVNHPLVGTPYGSALDLCIALAMLAWVLSILTREYSWVDRIWSLVPPIYCLIVAADLEFQSSRVNVMTVLATLWSIRLTFNYALKGGYWFGGEDYRWIYLRKQLSTLEFQLVNFFVTAAGQMAIVWLFTAPVHQAWLHSRQPLGWLDLLAVSVFLVLMAFEAIADMQMWRFQQNKRRQAKAGAEVEPPFMDGGLFRFCRHPNYFCEMGMWVTFYAFAVSASAQIWHWTGLGCVLLILLFQPSTRLSEKISSEKYPGYSRYEATVPRFIPFARLGCIREK